jgi:hypothetical protein
MHNGHNSPNTEVLGILSRLKHYLPAQAPLKDFIHHNTLHALQHLEFHQALAHASDTFGYKVYCSLGQYRSFFKEGRIHEAILHTLLRDRFGEAEWQNWLQRMVHTTYHTGGHSPRIGRLRNSWMHHLHLNFNKEVHPLLFRIIGSYLDQGVSIWNFPGTNTFLDALIELERTSRVSFFRNASTKKLLLSRPTLESLLQQIVGDTLLFERYLFDQQFDHPGWSGMVNYLEDHPHALLDARYCSLESFCILELLLELDALRTRFGDQWQPLAEVVVQDKLELLEVQPMQEFDIVLSLWQEAYEWSYYDQVIAGLQHGVASSTPTHSVSFQALFCIDDRECSLRRYLESEEPTCATYGTPGFFNLDFYFQPSQSKHYTKSCPAPMRPRHLVLEVGSTTKLQREQAFSGDNFGWLGSWVYAPFVGFWAAILLAISIFKPMRSTAMVSSFRHMSRRGKLTVLHQAGSEMVNGLQVGFTAAELAERLEGLLRGIGLTEGFAPLVYLVAHGASSVNNTHYAGYDCGACSGRPGSVNARAMAEAANREEVRQILAKRGIVVPGGTRFVAALHDTTQDEVAWYDIERLPELLQQLHKGYSASFEKALHRNAKERARRFVLMSSRGVAQHIHKKIKLRAFSLFEPRPELNHATNALCIIGKRSFSSHLFLDRRSFLNSYEHHTDSSGRHLAAILQAVVPVCGGINLEYYFSTTDPQRLGAGSKLPHNVMGLLGVANGLDGDLRPGLPTQMIEVHEPLRLLIVVQQAPEIVLESLKVHPATEQWVKQGWVHLVSIHPHSMHAFVYRMGQMLPYSPHYGVPVYVAELDSLLESNAQFFPVVRTKAV